MVDNNLVDWRKKDDFNNLPKKKSLESLLFEFYKSKRNDSDCFQAFIAEGLSYQFIAYLYFIKDNQRFLPISQSRFDKIFEILEIEDFKTVGNASWDNYITFLDLVKQTREFLRAKDKNTTLLDAHTFLWILGQIHIEPKEIEFSLSLDNPKVEIDILNKDSEEPKLIPSNATKLNIAEWSEILLDADLTNELDISIFQALYSFQDHR